MRGAILYAPGDVRFEERADPKIINPTDAVIRTAATCVCGSDLWDYRGINPVEQPTPFGHEYVGVVEEVGSEVTAVKPGQFVIGSFFASDNTCANCRNGYQTSCLHREFVGAEGARPKVRIPLADGTLVATPDLPPRSLRQSAGLLRRDGDRLVRRRCRRGAPGETVAVVGDGAVGLLGVIAAKELGATRIIAMSRHESRQKLAREFGATDVVAERGVEGIARLKEMNGGIGADRVLECVGTPESMQQALRSTRPGGNVGFVGVPHGVALAGEELFYSHVGLHGGPAPVRGFLPELIDRVLSGRIDPGKVFDLTLPLEQVADAYQAMDERRAIKALLTP